MKKSRAIILSLLLISCFCIACNADSGTEAPTVQQTVTAQQGNFQVLPETAATLSGTSLNIMLARTYEEKALGLMYYPSLEENRGMLFVYSAPRSMSFWMKNTMIPLDLIFFSPDLEITEWIKNMQPGYGSPEVTLPRYKSTGPAQYALELNAGMIDKLGLKVGDRLDIPLTLLYSD